MNSSPKAAASSAERPLGAVEKLFYLLDRNHPTHLAIIGEVDGPTSIEQWQSGLDSVAQHCPLVWSRIETDSRGQPAFRPVAPGAIPMRVVSLNESGWTDEVGMQMALSFDTLQPPLLRATLLHAPERAIIILAAHHSIADGASLSFFLADLLRSMSKQALVCSRESRSLEHLVKLMYGPKPEPMASDGARTVQAVRPPTAYRHADGTAPRISARRLTPGMTLSLRDRAKAERTTVHSVLVASLMVSISRVSPGTGWAPIRVGSPIDLRRRLLDQSDHLGLCMSNIVVANDGPHGLDLWAHARYLGQGFEFVRTPTALASMVAGLRDALADVRETELAKTMFSEVAADEALLTNLGVVDVPRVYGKLRLESVWGPSVCRGFIDEQVIGAATFNDQLQLLHTSHAPFEGLLEQMVNEIEVALSLS